MKISRKKTEYMTTDMNGDQQDTIRLEGVYVKRVYKFKYLVSMMDAAGEMETGLNVTC